MKFFFNLIAVFILLLGGCCQRPAADNTAIGMKDSAALITVSKTIENAGGDLINPGTGMVVYYRLTYGNPGPDTARNVVLCNRIPEHARYFTNLQGTAEGWEIQYAHVQDPDQSYGSADYDTRTENVLWVRYRKAAVTGFETNKTLFIGVMLN